MVEGYFKLSEHGTTVRTEIIAGATTFLTMAYINFVNPDILSHAGMDRGAVFVATCLAAAIGSAIMGLYANYPIAQAPGMGLNAYFAFVIVGSMGYSWQVALTVVFLSGLLFLILSILPVREWIINSIPRSQKLAIAAGIGLFLAIIALENAGIVIAHPATLVGLGDLKSTTVLLACLGLVVISALSVRRVPGAILIGILSITIVGIALGETPAGDIFAMPPSLAPTFFQFDFAHVLEIGFVTAVFVLLLFDLFDSAGTLIGVAYQGGLLDADGRLPRLRQALIADSTATVAGSIIGTSTTTSYIESTAGIQAGGRTGLTAVVVAILFLVALFFAPLAATIPSYATAPAILFVACMMTRSLADLDWDDVSEYVPAVITAISMPLTFSISTGIGLGFISYAAIKLLAGKFTEISPTVAVLALIFVAKFAVG
ncbi:MAG: NCS2 family permease [Alphaproteobacteria bacterium]|nr:NCS2 family permease [Alphaproteobacteria bacterium]